MDIIEVKNLLRVNDTYLKRNFNVKGIGILGSYIEGKQKAKSDLDILIEFERGHKDFFNYMRLKSYLEELIGMKVDLVIKEAIKPGLKQKILEKVEYV